MAAPPPPRVQLNDDPNNTHPPQASGLQANRTPLYLETLSSNFDSSSNAEEQWRLRGNIEDVPIEKFIGSLLPTPPALGTLLKALDEKPIQQALNQLKSATFEEDLHQPLETLINFIIQVGYSLQVNTKVAFPVAYVALGSPLLRESQRVRKPDGVLVESVVAERCRGGSMAPPPLEPVPNQGGPGVSRTSMNAVPVVKQEVPPWAKILVSFEVKLHRRDIAKEHNGTVSLSHSESVRPPSSSHSQQSENQVAVQKHLQIVGYLAEMRSALGNRTHTFGCVIHGGYFEFWFADPLGVIRSEHQELSVRLAEFAQVVIGLATCGPEELGFDKSFIPPPGSASIIPENLAGWHYQVDEDNEVEILDIRNVRWGLGGTGTSVYTICWSGRRAILKASYPLAIREREAVLLRKARDCIQDGVTEILHDASKEEVSAGFRKKLAVECVEPALDRRQEVLVLELLWELNCVRHIEDYTDAFIEIIQNLHTLYEKGRILHRDISSANLMMRPNSNNKPRGVINDFDLAVDLTAIPEHDHSLIHRTGTLPFLAVELLSESPPRHIFRFDLESCLYVYLWDAVHYIHGEPNKTNKSDTTITAWASADPGTNADAKAAGLPRLLMYKSQLFGDRQPLILQVGSALNLLSSWRAALETAVFSGTPMDASEWEKAAGHFTFERVHEIFKTIRARYGGPHPFPRKCKGPNQPFEHPDTGGYVASVFHTLDSNGCSPFYDPWGLGKTYIAPEAPSV